MSISILIPNYNGKKWLTTCLPAIHSQIDQHDEVIIVDNGSSDGSKDFIRNNFPDTRIIHFEKNLGFAKAINAGISAAKGEYILFLNNDTKVQPDALQHLYNTLQSSAPEIAAVQPMMLQMDSPELIDDAGDQLSWYGAATKMGHGQLLTDFVPPNSIFSPSGGAALLRHSFLREMKGLDESFFAYLEDIDLGLRGQLAGYKFILCPEAKVWHAGHGSNINSSRYVKLLTCNRLLLWTKNIPVRLWWRNLLPFLYGQLYFFLAYRRPVSSLLGYLRFIKYLPKTISYRKDHLSQRKIADHRLEQIIHSHKPSPSLAQLSIGYLKGLMRMLTGRRKS